jgi:CRISPR-associated endonuclease/helicase Cas3
MSELLAHSAPPDRPDLGPQPYASHVRGVRLGAHARIEAVVRYAKNPPPGLMEAVLMGAEFHDLGKLDEDNQTVLRGGRGGRLPVEHIDAGTAHLLHAQRENRAAAWLVRSHHAPGLPAWAVENNRPYPLRGRRRVDGDPDAHAVCIQRTQTMLDSYLRLHEESAGCTPVPACAEIHGLALRLGLSCLVDADHTDSAFAETGVPLSNPPATRWAERLEQLDAFVAALPSDDPRRTILRQNFYVACRDSPIDTPILACEGPVGIGKTTAIMAHLLRRAQSADSVVGHPSHPMRHIIVVAPFTNIISQTVDRLRKALVLPGEYADQVVAEHHHRADFASAESRSMATLWRSPIVVTTAVQFFETLAANDPSRLRKLHELPGSAVLIDEAHACLPVRLWPQNWRWMHELAERWGCRFVLASGSLVRFWESSRIVQQPLTLPELAADASGAAQAVESERIRYEILKKAVTRNELCALIRAASSPRLVILNTVQSAAVIAHDLNSLGESVEHLSTTLCPRDRERILRRVQHRLKHDLTSWTLVATSCVEAGVDLSFSTAFRESSSVASVIQVGGRVNRHGLHSAATVFIFNLADDQEGRWTTRHPEFKDSSNILNEMARRNWLNERGPSELVTQAMEMELKGRAGNQDELGIAEASRDYPGAADQGRVIQSDTRIVVVDRRLVAFIEKGGRPKPRMLQRRSVQLWLAEIKRLTLEPIGFHGELYRWGGVYDPELLGCMADLIERLKIQQLGNIV